MGAELSVPRPFSPLLFSSLRTFLDDVHPILREEPENFTSAVLESICLTSERDGAVCEARQARCPCAITSVLVCYSTRECLRTQAEADSARSGVEYSARQHGDQIVRPHYAGVDPTRPFRFRDGRELLITHVAPDDEIELQAATREHPVGDPLVVSDDRSALSVGHREPRLCYRALRSARAKQGKDRQNGEQTSFTSHLKDLHGLARNEPFKPAEEEST